MGEEDSRGNVCYVIPTPEFVRSNAADPFLENALSNGGVFWRSWSFSCALIGPFISDFIESSNGTEPFDAYPPSK